MSNQSGSGSTRSNTLWLVIGGLGIGAICICLVAGLGIAAFAIVGARSAAASTFIPTVLAAPTAVSPQATLAPAPTDTSEAILPTETPAESLPTEVTETPTDSQAPELLIKPGYWTALTKDDAPLAITFQVDDQDMIENFAVYFTLNQDCDVIQGDGIPDPDKIPVTAPKFNGVWETKGPQFITSYDLDGNVLDTQTLKGFLNYNFNRAGPGLGYGCALGSQSSFTATWASDTPVPVPDVNAVTPTP
jgi:hypothetical protein